METSTIIYIIVILTIIILLVYYFWYINKEDDTNKELPYDLINKYDITIVDIFESISKKYGRYPALKYKVGDKWSTVSYSQYYNLSNEFAEKLLYYIGPNPRVAILSHNRPEWFYVHMGTIMAGGCSIGIYPTASSDNCSFIINHSNVDLLVVEDLKQLSKLFNVKIPTVKLIITLNDLDELNKKDEPYKDEIYEDLVENIKSNNPKLTIIYYNKYLKNSIGSIGLSTYIQIGTPDIDDNAAIIYTSGTTGDPKGVVITHRNIITSVRDGLNAVRSRSNINICIQERYISYLPLNHIAAQMMDIYTPIASVGIVHFADKNAIKDSLKDTMVEVQPTIFIGVPRVWEKIMEKIKEKEQDPYRLVNKLFVNKIIIKEIGLDKAKYCISAAAPVSQETRSFFSELGIELCDVYGMSETSGPISMAVPGCSKGVGKPLMNLKIDKDTNEILVKGDAVFKEYYKNKKATIDTFNEKNWLKTGDTGYIDRGGSLYVTGRIKDLIITAGGENISPIIIEDMLLSELNKDKKYFDYAVVIGDQRKYLSVLLIPTKNYTNNSEMKKYIESSINKVNNKAPNTASTIKKHLILEQIMENVSNNEEIDFNDCLTPTLKIKRKMINDKYKTFIDKLYETD